VVEGRDAHKVKARIANIMIKYVVRRFIEKKPPIQTNTSLSWRWVGLYPCYEEMSREEIFTGISLQGVC
jgi:hypothetical protein